MQQAPTAAQGGALPQTRAELDALAATRAELKDQLTSVSQMRMNVFAQMVNARDPEARADLQRRMTSLDSRIARLESQLLAADDAIASSLAQGAAGGGGLMVPPAAPPALAPPPGVSVAVPDHMFHDVVNSIQEGFAGGLVASGLVFILVATIFYRMARKRTRQLFESLAADQARRFEQLQNAIDVVAVETERISEAQRFVSRRVNELGAGEAQPVGAPRAAEPVRSESR